MNAIHSKIKFPSTAPDRIALRGTVSPEAHFIMRLAAFRGVPVERWAEMPFVTTTLIAGDLARL